jgi:hypothetical protein
LGRKTGGARGMLFLVDPQGKAVRLETGYDLEGIFILFRKAVVRVLEDGDQEKSRTSEGKKVSGRRLSVVCGRKNLLDRINKIYKII